MAEGYGLFEQVRDDGKLSASISIAEGTLDVSEIVLSTGDAPIKKAIVFKGTEEIDVNIGVKFEVKDGELNLKLDEATTLKAGQRIQIEVS